MTASRRVSYEQLEILWDFLNTHKDIATGYNKSAQAREMSRRMWTDVTQNLNSMVGGAVKDSKGWAAYWVDYKGKIKRKCAAIRTSHSRTGGGPSNILTLTDIEKKYLSILGEDYGMGLPGVQVDPFDTNSVHAPSTSQASEVSLTILDIEPTEAVDQNIINRDAPHILPPGTEQVEHQSPPIVQPASRASISRPVRQRRRTSITQDDARRSLVESGRRRADATQNIYEGLNSIETVLSRIAAVLERIENRLATNEQ